MKKVVISFLVLLSWTISSAQVIETIPLPDAQKTGGMPVMEAFQLRKTQRSFSSKELTSQQLSNLQVILSQPVAYPGE